MNCTKLKFSSFAGFAFVLGLFASASNADPGSAWPVLRPPVGNDEASVIDEPRPEAAWQAEFRRAYRLEDGEILKRVTAPFPPSRKEYCQSLKVANGRMKHDKMSLSYRWDGKDVNVHSLGGTDNEPIGCALSRVLWDIGIPSQDIEGDPELLRRHVPGEFVLRTGVPAEKVVPRLEQILREELQLPIQLALVEVEREVIVVGGKYESKPRANRRANTVDLFAVAPKDAPAGGGSGTFDEFLKETGGFIGRRLINNLAETPKSRIMWRYHNSEQVLPGPDPNQDADGVLKNVTAQTGLTFKPEKRKIQVLLVKAK